MNDEWGAFNAHVDVIHQELPIGHEPREDSRQGHFDPSEEPSGSSCFQGVKAELTTKAGTDNSTTSPAASSFHSIDNASPVSPSDFGAQDAMTASPSSAANNSSNTTNGLNMNHHFNHSQNTQQQQQNMDRCVASNFKMTTTAATKVGAPVGGTTVSVDADRWADSHLAYSLFQESASSFIQALSPKSASLAPAPPACHDKLSGMIPGIHEYMDSRNSFTQLTGSSEVPHAAPLVAPVVNNSNTSSTSPLSHSESTWQANAAGGGGTANWQRPVLGMSQATELTILNDESRKDYFLTKNELDFLGGGGFQSRSAGGGDFNSLPFSKSVNDADTRGVFSTKIGKSPITGDAVLDIDACTPSIVRPVRGTGHNAVGGHNTSSTDNSGGELLSFVTTKSSDSPSTPASTSHFPEIHSAASAGGFGGGDTNSVDVLGRSMNSSSIHDMLESTANKQITAPGVTTHLPLAAVDPSVSRRQSTSSVSSSSSVLSIFDLPKPSRNKGGRPPECVSATAVVDSEMGSVRRPVARVSPEELEDAEKKMVFLLNIANEKITPVGWCADMKAEDVKEAILCGCDAMVDSGFRLREVIPVKPKLNSLIPMDEDGNKLIVEDRQAVANSSFIDINTATPAAVGEVHTSDIIEVNIDGQRRCYTCGRVYEFEQFHELISGRTYILEKGVERIDLKGVTGDRLRRLRIEIAPLLHVEAQKALTKMHTGSNLLKHTRKGFPHLRQFQLCRDNRRLIWYSGSKGRAETTVGLEAVMEVKFGQTTTTFQKYQLPMLSHLSFSIVYLKQVGALRAKRTLDLTCKDEIEFDYWLTGIKAAICASKTLGISKQRLLEHSRRFRTALVQNNISVKLSELPEALPADAVSLAKCVDLPIHTRPDIERKIVRIAQRLSALKVKVKTIPPPPQPTAPATTATTTEQQTAATQGAPTATTATVPPPPVITAGGTILGASVGPGATGAVVIQGTAQSPVSAAASTGADSTTAPSAESQSSATSWLSMWLRKSDGKSEQSAATQAVDDLEDDSMERLRMGELLQVVEGLIQNARDGLTEFDAMQQALAETPQSADTTQNAAVDVVAAQPTDANQHQTAKLKLLNQTLWKAEVDLENAEDMYRRIANPGMGSPLERTISELNQQFSEEFSRIGDQISHKFVSWFSPSSATTT